MCLSSLSPDGSKKFAMSVPDPVSRVFRRDRARAMLVVVPEPTKSRRICGKNLFRFGFVIVSTRPISVVITVLLKRSDCTRIEALSNWRPQIKDLDLCSRIPLVDIVRFDRFP